MSFAEHLDADRRLGILRLLREVGGSANESVLYGGVVGLGHVRSTRDDVRKDIAWFAERGLVESRYFQDKVLIADITERGIDVAKGKVAVEGVKRPERIEP